ncbi:MAG TPA: hypothetical protein VKB68_08445 [Stellaceae bacterium]|nr:hypothetical protein [Stellaceae bacterium]
MIAGDNRADRRARGCEPRIEIIVTSLYLNLIPLFGIATAAAFGSYPTGQQLVGCALVIIGVALLRRPKAAD